MKLWTCGRRNADDVETGATAVEYALLVAGIAIVIVLGVTVFGTAVAGLFSINW